MATAGAQRLWTVEEFGDRPDPGRIQVYRERHDVGRVLTNDFGVVAERGPDTVRGADVAYSSHGRVPEGPLPNQYLDVAPELIVEVLSPSDPGAGVSASRVAPGLPSERISNL